MIEKEANTILFGHRRFGVWCIFFYCWPIVWPSVISCVFPLALPRFLRFSQLWPKHIANNLRKLGGLCKELYIIYAFSMHMHFFVCRSLSLFRNKKSTTTTTNKWFFSLTVYQIRHFVCLCAYSNKYMCTPMFEILNWGETILCSVFYLILLAAVFVNVVVAAVSDYGCGRCFWPGIKYVHEYECMNLIVYFQSDRFYEIYIFIASDWHHLLRLTFHVALYDPFHIQHQHFSFRNTSICQQLFSVFYLSLSLSLTFCISFSV